MNPYVTWIIATFFAFFQFFLQTASSIMGPEWMQDFQLDKVGLSNLSAAFFYTYSLMQIPAGILFDRYQPRYILAIAASILTAGCLLLAYTHNYTIALIARLLMGLGASCGFVGLLQVCASSFPPQRFALMLGISEGMAMLSVSGSVMLLGWLINHYSWRMIMFGSAGITLLLTIAILLFVPKHHEEQYSSHEKELLSFKVIAKRLKIIFSSRQVILGSLYGFFIFAIINAFTSLWGVSFVVNTTEYSRQLAANMVALVFIGIAVGGPLSGWLSKILDGHKIILQTGALLSTITMSMIVFVPQLSEITFFILFFLMGVVCSAYIQCFAIIKASVHPSIRATALATTNMILMLSAPILQLLIGWLLQSHFMGLSLDNSMTYRLSLGVLPLGMLIAFILAFGLKEPQS